MTCRSSVSAAGPATYAFTPGGVWCLLNDLADSVHTLVGQGLALFAGEVQHHVGRFAVGALSPGRRERVAPEVLDVLDVLGVLLQLAE